MSDGNAWVDCSCGGRHWGSHGAAGVVIVHAAGDQVLMQLRADWTHGGGTWAFPGGARALSETPVEAAMRELHEELQVPAASLEVLHEQVWTDHGDWRYHTVIARAVGVIDPVLNNESERADWVALDAVADLPLHAALAPIWPDVLAVLREVSAPAG
jgi:8-oxo-dGTP pyrophosphatase MutT (NUDIX family)